MPITWRHLSGVRENLDIVLEAHIRDNWDNTNITPNMTPVFENLSHLPSNVIDDDNITDPNLVRLSIESRKRTEDDDDEPLGDSAHTWKIRIQIDLWAENYIILTQVEDEINRIIWTIRPNENTRLNKSTGVRPPVVGSSASEAGRFVPDEVDFEFLGPENEGISHRVGSQGTLEVWAFKDKS